MNKKSSQFKEYIHSLAKEAKNTNSSKEYQRIATILVQELDYLVQFRLKKYRRFDNAEDLYQEGRAAILKALKSFQPDKGNFIFWASWYIKTRISREANKHSTIKIPIKKAKKIQPHKVTQDVEEIFDSGNGAYEEYISKEIQDNVRETIKSLPPLEGKILELNGIKQYSIYEISNDLKISESHCIKLLENAKQMFRQNISR